MRFVHTSDWHLGRSFGTYGLLPDQGRFLDWFVELATGVGADLVVIAGDIYDRSSPPAEAIALFDDAVARLHRTGIEVVAIAGNHDNPERLALYSAITEHHGVILRGGYRAAGSVVVRDYSDGPLAIAPIPFLDPRLVPASTSLFPDPAGPYTHHSVTDRAAAAARAAVPAGMRSLAVAHGFVAGGQGSDSEKLIVGSVGGTDHVGRACFAAFDYTALGHLHKPQRVAGSETIRYSGSPLPYSFSERDAKNILVVDMDRSGRCDVDAIEIPIGRRVRTIRDSFDNLIGGDGDRHNLVRIELTDASLVRDAKRRLEARFPHLIELTLAPLSGRSAELDPPSVSGLTRTLAGDVARFLQVVSGEDLAIDDFDAILEALAAEGMDLGDLEAARALLDERPGGGIAA